MKHRGRVTCLVLALLAFAATDSAAQDGSEVDLKRATAASLLMNGRANLLEAEALWVQAQAAALKAPDEAALLRAQAVNQLEQARLNHATASKVLEELRGMQLKNDAMKRDLERMAALADAAQARLDAVTEWGRDLDLRWQSVHLRILAARTDRTFFDDYDSLLRNQFVKQMARESLAARYEEKSLLSDGEPGITEAEFDCREPKNLQRPEVRWPQERRESLTDLNKWLTPYALFDFLREYRNCRIFVRWPKPTRKVGRTNAYRLLLRAFEVCKEAHDLTRAETDKVQMDAVKDLLELIKQNRTLYQSFPQFGPP